jgi:ATP-dependent helicase HrpB
LPAVSSLPPGWADQVGLALLNAYPDRLAFRTQTLGVEGLFQLPSARILRVRGALAAETTLVIPEADAGSARLGSEGVGTVWLAAPVDRDAARSLLGDLVESKVEIEWSGWRARAFRSRTWGSLSFERTGLSLTELQTELRASLAQRLADPTVELPWSATTRQLWVRLGFLKAQGPVEWGWLADLADLSQPEVLTERSFSALLHNSLPHDLRRRLDAEAPETLVVPSGSRRKLEYRDDGREAGQGSVHLEVRIQEVFGLPNSPHIGSQTVVLHLLNPGHKPLQITSDLASFWSTTYQEIRKQMRGQYPRHYWPDNPLEAEPTSRPKPKSQPK